MKKMIILIVTIIALGVLINFLFENYKTNEEIKADNSLFVFSDDNFRFLMNVNNDNDFDLGNKILREMKEEKEKIIQSFLTNSKEKIVFNPSNIDTLKLIIDNNNYKYSSTLDKGIIDKSYNDLLARKIFNYINERMITKIDIYTVTPTEAGNIPLPPGILSNIEVDSDDNR
ncbi:hypothetical protein ACFO3O_21385 [Dokdonia ponticola]|uniref:GerMN domain-containing protein n=1 Tax=Dokdonia ponticola TaxID=2041041 RepID=A0ABV9I2R2_9FLAO